ncbi:helix-turn-helix domain-containing protein [Vagococcus carniphilus]|uniref:helix-turn-helix domain-containing protein n=1 Tax=Vagococcus carniphilus TaxID=218144 RepID=UPI00288C67D3|nr:helix-turn-helix domain-containing protein [Vagococcus carniphilus]MDT2832210.1 helix-turn-helix domain-containing protein [Vagococcus carniphilus]MDT2840706.1 helix-turn-helix domain-containing protein [Vagococcus carniphilus]MDT2855682.1 helix-turn-helix domain-containing protein [Vagococcus carniphilus]
MAQNLALVSMKDLEAFVIKQSIKNEVWGPKQAAEYLECSESHLKKLANKGEVPGHKLGNDWKFSSIALFELISKKDLKK